MQYMGRPHNCSRPIPSILWCNLWAWLITFRSQSRAYCGATSGLGSSCFESYPNHMMVQLIGWAHHLPTPFPSMLWFKLWAGLIAFRDQSWTCCVLGAGSVTNMCVANGLNSGSVVQHLIAYGLGAGSIVIYIVALACEREVL